MYILDKALIKILFLISLLLSTIYLQGQENTDSTSFIKPHHLIIGEATFYGASMLILNEAWYADYPRSDFHWFNDNNEWLQMDKIGHSYATYQIAYQNSYILQKTGMPKKKAMWISTGLSVFAISSIELFDGFSDEWGASPGDLLANSMGGLLYLSQELLWNEQKVRMKFNYLPSPYADKRPEALGSNYHESLLKDYNGQTYWLSINLNKTLGTTFFPSWMALAVGYGATGLLGGEANPEGFENITRHRQIFLSPDIDWQNIKTKRKGLIILFR
ncbi:MAG: DUF2279 domain-containing protein, partial [Salinivirgaceae bacterium]